MNLKKISKEQPENFEFTSASLESANKIIKKYPKGKQQSAVMALLYLVQSQNNNWIPLAAIKYIAVFVQKTPSSIIFYPDKKIKTPEDLKGKWIACAGPGFDRE